MDIHEIRAKNYAALKASFDKQEAAQGIEPRGALNRFGDKTGVSPRYLSHINNGRKNIGEATARAFEGAFRLPHGWMDHDHASGTDPATPDESKFLSVALRLYRHNPVDAQARVMQLMQDMMFGNPELPGK